MVFKTAYSCNLPLLQTVLPDQVFSYQTMYHPELLFANFLDDFALLKKGHYAANA